MKGLYIHIPFCKSKCNYCGFYSVVDAGMDMVIQYFNALLQDIINYDDLNFDTLYVGGGTPTLIDANIIDEFFSKLFKKINFNNLEFTVEANPESLTSEHLKVFKTFNVNRISLGVQSTDEKVLKFLGRIHKPADVDNSLKLIEKIMPDANINLDFIYDIPQTDIEIQKKSLKDIMNYNPNHISAYSYSFDTEFLKEFSQNEQSDEMFLYVRNTLINSDYNHYEVSNFAKENCKSVHNKIYWTMNEYLGIGASSHSMLLNKSNKRVRFEKEKNVLKYIENPLEKINPVEVDFDEMLKEEIIFGLRMLEGINIEKLKIKYGKSVDKFLFYCKRMSDENLICFKGENLCVTEKGLLLLESLSEYFWSLEL